MAVNSLERQALALEERFAHLAQNHPCLGRAPNKGRLHLPVSPASHLTCRFCTRAFNAQEARPGVARRVLPVGEAPGIVEKALALVPELAVVGIAGPGDSLATGHAIECFTALRGRFPSLIGCMSTNGLALPENAEAIARAGVASVTVTVNAVDPEILWRIVEYAVIDGERREGPEAMAAMIERQLAGIERLVGLGVLVKINTVLISEINGAHVEAIARACAALGASIMNVMPLIPQGDLAGLAAPGCDELAAAREAVERHLPVFRHCQHCRADACGVLGKEDVSARLYENLEVEETFSHG
jgi:nitrogen fixation protein NifB